jgi:hypothetical protein
MRLAHRRRAHRRRRRRRRRRVNALAIAAPAISRRHSVWAMAPTMPAVSRNRCTCLFAERIFNRRFLVCRRTRRRGTIGRAIRIRRCTIARHADRRQRRRSDVGRRRRRRLSADARQLWRAGRARRHELPPAVLATALAKLALPTVCLGTLATSLAVVARLSRNVARYSICSLFTRATHHKKYNRSFSTKRSISRITIIIASMCDCALVCCVSGPSADWCLTDYVRRRGANSMTWRCSPRG